MKPNLIKMDISKQETQQQTHSCHFPATSCGRLGGGVVCVQMEVEAPPPSPPSPLQGCKSLTPIKPTKDDCYWHCLPLKTGSVRKERGDAGLSFSATETGIPWVRDPPWKGIPLYSSLRSLSIAQTRMLQHQPFQPRSWSGGSLGTRGPQGKHSTTPERPSSAGHAPTPPPGETPETPGNPIYLHSPLPPRPIPTHGA